MAVDAVEHSAVAAVLGWLLRTAERDHTALVNDALGSLPGRVRGYRILTLAAASAERQNYISQRLGIDRTVMTSLLDDLETAELIRRMPDATDRRAHLIKITGRGRSVVGRLAEQVADADHQFLKALEPAEQIQFQAMLRRLATTDPSPGRERPPDCASNSNQTSPTELRA